MVSRCTARWEISPRRRYESTRCRSSSWATSSLLYGSPKGSGGGKTYVHHETRLLACVKTADLLTTAQFSGMMCVKNVLLRTSPWYFPQLGLVAQIWTDNKGDLLRRPPLKYIQSDITSWEWIRRPGCQDCRTFCLRSPGYLQESYSWWYPRNLSGHCCLYHIL